MRVIINLILFSFVGIIVSLAAIGHVGQQATETVHREHIDVIHNLNVSTEEATAVADMLSLKSMLGGREDHLPLRLEFEDGGYRLWVGCDLNADNASMTISLGKVLASAISAGCFQGRPVELVYCRKYNDPVLFVSSHADLKQLVRLGEDLVFYGDGITREQAATFAERFADANLLQNAGGIVRISKPEGTYRLQTLVLKSEVSELTADQLRSDLTTLQTQVFDGEAVRWEPFEDIDEPITHLVNELPAAAPQLNTFTKGVVSIEHGPGLEETLLEAIADQILALREQPLTLTLTRSDNDFSLGLDFEFGADANETMRAVSELIGRQVLTALPDQAHLTTTLRNQQGDTIASFPIEDPAGAFQKFGGSVIYYAAPITHTDVESLHEAFANEGWILEDNQSMIWLRRNDLGTSVQIAFPMSEFDEEMRAEFTQLRTKLQQQLSLDESFRLIVGGICGGKSDAYAIDGSSSQSQ